MTGPSDSARTRRRTGIYGCKVRRVEGLKERGPQGPDSAVFLLPATPAVSRRRLRTTLAVTVFHAISRATRTALDDPEASLSAWLDGRPEHLPAVALLDCVATAGAATTQAYRSHLWGWSGRTHPYVSVASLGGTPKLRWSIAVDIHQVADAETQARRLIGSRRLAPPPGEDGRFFSKRQSRLATMAPLLRPARCGTAATAWNAWMPLLCGLLADQLVDDVAVALDRSERA